MGPHIFNSVSSTLTPTCSNFVVLSACSVNMVSVQRNVCGLFWVEGGWRSEQLSLCSHLEILLPSAVALCHSNHTQTLDPTTAEQNIPFKHCFRWVCKHESKTSSFRVCLLFSKSEHVMQLIFMSNLIINVSPFFLIIPTPRGLKFIMYTCKPNWLRYIKPIVARLKCWRREWSIALSVWPVCPRAWGQAVCVCSAGGPERAQGLIWVPEFSRADGW